MSINVDFYIDTDSTFPGPRPVKGQGPRLLPEEEARLREAIRQGVIGFTLDRKGVPRIAFTRDWYYWVWRILGKPPSEEETIQAVLDLLGLPPEVRNKAIQNIFSPESQRLFLKYFHIQPAPKYLWEMRTVFAQDNPADRERVLQHLTSPANLQWLAQRLGRWPTVGDVIKYHRQLLKRELPDVAAFGEGATARRVLQELRRH